MVEMRGKCVLRGNETACDEALGPRRTWRVQRTKKQQYRQRVLATRGDDTSCGSCDASRQIDS